MKYLILLALVISTPLHATDVNLKVMNSNDYFALLDKQRGHAFTLFFWSLECSPCLKELKTISQFPQAQKRSFVFVATDGIEMKSEVLSFIEYSNLNDQQHWVVNSDEFDEFRASIDARWYGETPRIYRYDAKQNRVLIKPSDLASNAGKP